MDPTQYGSHVWFTLHSFCGLATEEHKRVTLAKWIKQLAEVFPCEICAEHLRQTMRAYPIERFMDSAESLLKYTYILHDAANNNVNSTHLGQPRKISPPWEEVKAMYLSVPTPEPEVARPIPASAATSAPRTQNGRMVITHPAFQQLKASFRPTMRR